MAATSAQQAVTSTRVRVFDAGGDVSHMVIKTTGATSVFLGGDNVTTSNGFELASGATLVLPNAQDAGDDIYAVAVASSTVHVLAY
jgi:hypothetical protein